MTTYTNHDIGCYLDGARGIYMTDAIIGFAEVQGHKPDLTDVPMVDGMYHLHEYEFASELEDEAEEYMNDKHGVEGCYWGRSEQGDWGLWQVEDNEGETQ